MARPTSLEDQKISNAEQIWPYRFNDRAYLRQALQLPDDNHRDGNKTLALLGDAVIKLVLVTEGIRRNATRGEINNVVSHTASNAHLAHRGFSTRLAECVYRNPSQGHQIFAGPMASTMEAIIGAVFEDSGRSVAAAASVMEALGISWPQ